MNLRYHFQCGNIFVDIKVLAGAFILHNEARMFQWNDLSEKMVFIIQPVQKLLILARSQAKAGIRFDAQRYELMDALHHKTFYRIRQFPAVVIIVILLPLIHTRNSKTQRAGGIDEEILVERPGASIGVDHFIDEH